jgi:uncharacterized protein
MVCPSTQGVPLPFTRRQFITAAGASGLGLTIIGRADPLFAASSAASRTIARTPGYGPLAADPQGLLDLPAGFHYSVVSRAGDPLTDWRGNRVAATVPGRQDGASAFPGRDQSVLIVQNHEQGEAAVHPVVADPLWTYDPLAKGGTTTIRVDHRAQRVSEYVSLAGTWNNCAGGPTPWGRWLSCEEFDGGRVWECDPLGVAPAVVRPALGVFNHDAAAVDPDRGHVYLTEDKTDGRLYRFRPTAYPDLSAGVLEVATVVSGLVQWTAVPDPSAALLPTRQQVPASTAFKGGEGAWYGGGTLWFTTKGDNRLWELDVVTSKLSVIYDAGAVSNPVLTGVDNIVRSASRDLFVAEDGGDMQLVILRPNGEVWPFLQMVNQTGSELAGPAFTPSGTRLYVSSQRGPTGTGPGVTYEVQGPFLLS